jgi:superfamily II DNA or RNA helicase
MTDIVNVEYLNAVHMIVRADPGTAHEISDYFSFKPEGIEFHPKVRARMWDGYFRLFQPMKKLLYVGLLPHLKTFCKDRDYVLNIADELKDDHTIPDDYAYELAKQIGLNEKFKPRDYQNNYVVQALRDKRSLNVSPTSSGKSLIIYLIQQHYQTTYGHRTLIIVPTIALVAQMAGDFAEYGCDPKEIYMIKGGVDKNPNEPSHTVYISTWQSLMKQPKSWFDQFGVVCGDEAHLLASKQTTAIMEKLVDCEYKHAFTGTLKSSEMKTHRLVLEGLFGSVRKFVSTKDLMDSGTVADFKIKCIVLSHPTDVRKAFKKEFNKVKENSKKYPAEREFLINCEKRNMFIRNLVWSLKDQNNLILFDLVNKHGKPLEELLKRDDRVLHFIHGGVSGDERERVRHLVENDPEKKHNILASYGVFSTGVNLRRLDNIVFASSSKSEIKILQSAGRVLRKGNGSDVATLYDIADDLSVGSYKNYTLQHFRKRIEIYSEEQFDFKIHTIEI